MPLGLEARCAHEKDRILEDTGRRDNVGHEVVRVNSDDFIDVLKESTQC